MKPGDSQMVPLDISTRENLCGSTRLVVTLNAAFGYFVILLIRVQFSLSILCMVRDPAIPDLNASDHVNGSGLAHLNSSGRHGVIGVPLNGSVNQANDQHEELDSECQSQAVQSSADNRQSIKGNIMDDTSSIWEGGDFEWDKPLQGFVLSAFFWGYVVTQIPGGWLACRFGPKHVISGGMFVANLAHILTPLAARVHPYLVILLRIIVGLGHGVVCPSLHGLFGKWAPPLERSILMTPTYAAGILASCIALALTGLLCDVIGWQAIFYIYGIISYIWLLLWCYNVYNSPARHPRIATGEKNYIQTAIGPSAYTKKLATPWGAILRSGPAWAINVAHFCDNWGQYTILTSVPAYMKEVLYFDIQTNGLLVSLPYLVMSLTAVACSQLADWLRRSHILSTTRVRKLFQTFGFVLPAGFLVALGFVHCSQRVLAVSLLTLSVGFQAFGRVGYSINHVDIAPRLSGLLCGISNTFATVPGMVAPYLAAAVTPNGTQEEWRLVFFLCSAVYILGLVVYLLLGSGEEQPWSQTPGDTSSSLEIDLTQPLSESQDRSGDRKTSNANPDMKEDIKCSGEFKQSEKANLKESLT